MSRNLSNAVVEEGLAACYGDDFYATQMGASYLSAQKYAAFVCALLRPESVVDLGCGRGTWLKAFKDKGVRKLVGYDGPWNSQADMVDQGIVFNGVDLNKTLQLIDDAGYDLAMSLEVAEHLNASSASGFVKSLTNLSDVVMFGAAYVGQGGMHHINEQPHTYWAALFRDNGYRPYDVFRPAFWGDPDIDFWYQQNTFLYVKGGSAAARDLPALGYEPIKNLCFMNCVHPDLYNQKILETRVASVLKRVAVDAIPERLLALARMIKARLPS